MDKRKLFSSLLAILASLRLIYCDDTHYLDLTD